MILVPPATGFTTNGIAWGKFFARSQTVSGEESAGNPPRWTAASKTDPTAHLFSAAHKRPQGEPPGAAFFSGPCAFWVTAWQCVRCYLISAGWPLWFTGWKAETMVTP